MFFEFIPLSGHVWVALQPKENLNIYVTDDHVQRRRAKALNNFWTEDVTEGSSGFGFSVVDRNYKKRSSHVEVLREEVIFPLLQSEFSKYFSRFSKDREM